EGFTGADISSICQEVKMKLLRAEIKKKPIKPSDELVLGVISIRRPSVNNKLLEEYSRFLEVYGERK
ncbi:MAG: AAA family ATPase, partial [Candidatus ainarchaeum sp.]|nr:AAA family ATPase [Candidatus ainarchaeum sp.]